MKVNKGKNQYSLKLNDRLYYNGACHMFMPKDTSILPLGNWNINSHLFISKKEFTRLIKTGKFKKIQWEVGICYIYKGN